MGNRLQLQSLLEETLGSRNVYFQPPESLVLKYPCIVYKRNNIRSMFADNSPYSLTVGYQLTVIDPNPDSEIVTKVFRLPMCGFVTHFTADNLNHDVYNIYY